MAGRGIPRRAPAAACVALPALGTFLPAASPVAQIFLFFAKAGLFVFGSGLAIVPFLYGGVVRGHHWLNDRQFVDPVAVAVIPPGPRVTPAAFLSYLLP